MSDSNAKIFHIYIYIYIYIYILYRRYFSNIGIKLFKLRPHTIKMVEKFHFFI